MKIRNGFVSNSSSSSFCIYGAELTYKMTDGYAEAHEDEDYDLESVFEDEGLEYHSFDGREFVGLAPWDIEDNETGAQFKQRVADTLKKLFGFAPKCDWYEETYYS